MQENPNPYIPAKPGLVIFDLDGTLYDQNKLRRIVMRKLLLRFLTFRFKILDFRIITCFRSERENRKGYTSDRLSEEQYEWCAAALKISRERVRTCIETYIYNFPLSFLKHAKFKGVDEFFSLLYEKHVKTVIYSDYPIEDKLKALRLSVNGAYCSTDVTINQFKPSLKALQLICREMKCESKNTVYIGDRDDHDGEGARMMGIPFILVDPKRTRTGIFYKQLAEQFKMKYD